MLSAVTRCGVAARPPCRTAGHHWPPGPVPFVLGPRSPQAAAAPTGEDRAASRRSEPSSRSPLTAEQAYPWPLLHGQDGESRQRSSKPGGHCGRSPPTTLLPPGYLFPYRRAPPVGHDGSLGPGFPPAGAAITPAVRPAFALALYAGFLSRLSRPLRARDSLSRACHPSQTAHLGLSPPRVSGLE